MKELHFRAVAKDVMKTLAAPGKPYYIAMGILFIILLNGIGCWIYQIYTGMGASGLMHPVGWGVYITNFVFWVGIAHSGTLISAILYLLRVKWRTSIFRTAEAMTLFAVMTAGLFPLIHMGRTWNFYWLMPYPNQRLLWINFRSPLVWDVFAVSTYMTVSFLFLFLGMIPDNAVIRDRTKGWRKKFHSLFSFGWRGTDQQWLHYHSTYLFLAALVTPLVISVHSVVSWDFAMAIVPGWHSTIFPPYFVAGAIFSGCALVVNLLIPMRKAFHLEKYITEWHFDNMGKIILFTSLIVTYSYIIEPFIAWYSGSIFEKEAFIYRAFGNYSKLFWLMVFGNCIFPLLLWFKKFRTNLVWIFTICIFVNVGMWLERFIIIVTSLAHEYDPYSWGTYTPSWIEIGITTGAFAWFFLWFLLFIKVFPCVAIVEIKEHLPMPPREVKQT